MIRPATAGEGVRDVLEWAAVEGLVAVGETIAGGFDFAGEEEEEEEEDSGDGERRERDWVHRGRSGEENGGSRWHLVIGELGVKTGGKVAEALTGCLWLTTFERITLEVFVAFFFFDLV